MRRKILKAKEKMNTDAGMYLWIGLMSAVVFISIYGMKILNPTYTDWLLAGGDLSQHYLGWEAYRASEWHFPLGMVDTLAYPNLTSIIFTDSIPLFALFFKIVSPILPLEFQYFGLWGILCFILQGLCAGRILNRYSSSRISTILLSVMFTITPTVIQRMFGHTALAGQWILLFGLDMVFNSEKYDEKKNVYITVAAMGVLSASVHIYYILMSGIILVGYIVNELLSHKNWKKCLTVLAIYLMSAVVVVFLFGGFRSGMKTGNGGLGEFSMNLNGFINPQGASAMFQTLPLYGDKQGEGFAYLGAGCIAAGLLSIVSLLSSPNLKRILKNNWKRGVSLLVIWLTSLLVALSPSITLGDKLLIQLNLPEFITDLWSIFRASGRIVWVACYVMMLLAMVLLLKTVNKRAMLLGALLMFSLQFYDTRFVLQAKRQQFGTMVEYHTLLATESFWESLADQKDIKHIVYGSDVELNWLFAITDWALGSGKTLNDFYFARSMEEQIQADREKALQELPEDTMFIFAREDEMDCLKYNLHFYDIDGIVVGYVHTIDGFQEIERGNER